MRPQATSHCPMKSVGSLEEAPAMLPASKWIVLPSPDRLRTRSPDFLAAASHCSRSVRDIVSRLPERLMRGQSRHAFRGIQAHQLSGTAASDAPHAGGSHEGTQGETAD